ncbi:RDD family protein [Aurantiacibacter poecillastricola]|uniref:RDD family protein n=1 Tax=Aurantiacibacter poecillastricola TaxID=3064385 RepID=UPI00273E2FC9|nr:RDD family protein [Aurantiacibacter sp. 219JJ12-13]MDP5262950.1 RDD family protein [Aurantiacibacter sp. 219JJ12-13]
MHYAGFWIRVAAYLIDAILLGVTSVVLLSIFGFGFTGSTVSSGGAFSATGYLDPAGNLFTLVLGIAYFAGLESSAWQATVGKKLLGLMVTDLSGNRISFLRALGRYFGKILSSLILMIGYIMVAFTGKKQGLHDMLASTLVLHGKPGEFGTKGVFD